MKKNIIDYYKHDLQGWECARAITQDGYKDQAYKEQIDRDTAVIAAFEVLEELQKHAILALEYIDDEPRVFELKNILITISSRFGYHEDGEGWSAKNCWCGECSDYNCIGCSNINAEPKEIPYDENKYIDQLKF